MFAKIPEVAVDEDGILIMVLIPMDRGINAFITPDEVITDNKKQLARYMIF